MKQRRALAKKVPKLVLVPQQAATNIRTAESITGCKANVGLP